MSVKQERIESNIAKEITKIIQFELRDPSIGFCTITHVKVTTDFSYATVYTTFLGQRGKQEAGIRALNRSKGRVRSLLAGKISIKKVPEITFVMDDTYEKASRIESIIDEINQKTK